MDSCMGVEQDLDKATSKFTTLNDHANKILEDLTTQVEELRNEISKETPNVPLSQGQTKIVNDLAASVKQSVFQLSTDHRELHATVSRVGKSIDRHFIADYAAVAPKAESFCSDTNRPIMEQAIAQHLYRQGLDEVGDSLVAEAGVAAERGSTFAQLQRCAAALAEGDPGPALAWATAREHELVHSPLPFTLHRMQALKLARTSGVTAAIQYARLQFPAHAARHERALAAAVCALAWCTAGAPHAPPAHYAALLDARALGAEAAELFVREACALLRLAPHSPLAGAVVAGARVLPALHDIRAKMSHPHVLAAWADDELPLEVELGEEGGGYHSVFACPILRQQASDHNPPMRLLCGHVISRDALNKLAMGLKLKCPYCPMEQSPSEARQIYFS